jgi:hypothetical protein
VSRVDCVYVAASSRDTRLARICIASIRFFYPDISIRLLTGDRLPRALLRQLRKHWGVELVDLQPGNYGWGLMKLEVLFGRPGERFLIVDADTVFTGLVLDLATDTDAPFVVDDETLPDVDLKRLYYDWDKMRAIDPRARPARGAFNSGQWFGTSGLLTRGDFEPLVAFDLPRVLRYPAMFMGGDQGVLNFVLLAKEAEGAIQVARRPLMRWPGHSMEGLTPESIQSGAAPALVIHWAGMKTALLRRAVGADVLLFFEQMYYARLRAGRLRRMGAAARQVYLQCHYYVRVTLVLGYRKWTARFR